MRPFLGTMRKRRTPEELFMGYRPSHEGRLANMFMNEFISYWAKSGRSLPIQVVFKAIAIFIERVLLEFNISWTEQLFDDQFAKLWEKEKRLRSVKFD